MAIAGGLGERREAGAAPHVDVGPMPVKQQRDDTLTTAVGGSVERRPAHLVAHLRIEALVDEPRYGLHVVSLRVVPDISGAQVVLVARLGHGY